MGSEKFSFPKKEIKEGGQRLAEKGPADWIKKEIEQMRGRFSEKEIKEFEEYESKKQRQRENRLNKIMAALTEVLKSKFPKDADKFEFAFEQISKEDAPNAGIPQFQRFAYYIYLRLKSKPAKKFKIQELFESDVNKKVANADIPKAYGSHYFDSNIKKGIEALS